MEKGKPAEEKESMGQKEQLKGNQLAEQGRPKFMRRKPRSSRNRRWQWGKGISLTMKGVK